MTFNYNRKFKNRNKVKINSFTQIKSNLKQYLSYQSINV